MPDPELEELQDRLRALTRRCLGEVPDYGVYVKSREPYRHRILTLVYSKENQEPIAFSAMVLWHVQLKHRRTPQPVLHLGLVLVAPEYRGRKIMYWAYHKPLFRFYLKRLFRPFWITSTTMEPVILGSVADSFSHVYPHYAPQSTPDPTPAQLEIVRTFVSEHGHEIGVWEEAVFDEERFVIQGSSLGSCRSLMLSYADTAKYRVEACNEFCRQVLDYSRGDEILQVGRVDLATLLRSLWWTFSKARRRFTALRVSRSGSSHAA
jgi:hypothetical protein